MRHLRRLPVYPILFCALVVWAAATHPGFTAADLRVDAGVVAAPAVRPGPARIPAADSPEPPPPPLVAEPVLDLPQQHSSYTVRTTPYVAPPPAPPPDPLPESRPEPDPGSNRAVGEALNADWGWADEWDCLDSLWTAESGWNEYDRNPSSGAYGIPQALPGRKMASAGDDWETNPATQITWGLGYIGGRYGSPCAAYAHFRSHRWY